MKNIPKVIYLQEGEAATVTDVQVNHVSRTIAKPHVSGSFKHSTLDVWAFAEWTGQHYIRLHECWVHRFADQRNKDNWKDTGELWKLWWENYR